MFFNVLFSIRYPFCFVKMVKYSDKATINGKSKRKISTNCYGLLRKPDL